MLYKCLSFLIICFHFRVMKTQWLVKSAMLCSFKAQVSSDQSYSGICALSPSRRKQTVYHLTHCTLSTHALLNMLIILTIIMIAGCSSLATHIHMHKSKSDVGEETKQRSTGKERQGERIAKGNRRRCVNDNVEYDSGRFIGFFCIGFCMEQQIFPAPTQYHD